MHFRHVNEINLCLTEKCSLRCIYCYKKKARQDERLLPISFASQTFDLVAADSAHSQITITLHGGEPLFAGAGHMADICSLLEKKALKASKSLVFAMQTSLSDLTGEHINVLKKHRIQIGVSLDGPGEVNDRQRGRGQQVIANLKRLIREVPHLVSGVICVLTKHNFQDAIAFFQFLYDLEINKGNFIVCRDNGAAKCQDIALDLSELTAIRKEMVQYHLDTRFSRFQEARTVHMLHRFLNPTAAKETIWGRGCYSKFCGAGIRVIEVLPNGDIFPCGPAVSNRRYFLGSIHDLDHKKYLSVLASLHREKKTGGDVCLSCVAALICEFSCPAYDTYTPDYRKVLCEATRMMYSYLETIDRELYSLREEIFKSSC